MDEEVTAVTDHKDGRQDPLPQEPFDAVKAVALPKSEQNSNPENMSGVLTPNNNASLTTDAADAQGANTYGEFAWPEGYVADPGAMAKFIPLAQKLGLQKQDAQSLASLYAEIDQERCREQARFIAENNAKWLREIQTHPEFGGKNLEHTSENVAAMMRRYATPLLMSQIRQMNVQNWPEMFFFLARVSQAVSEDCSPSSFTSNAPEKSTAQLLFPGLK